MPDNLSVDFIKKNEIPEGATIPTLVDIEQKELEFKIKKRKFIIKMAIYIPLALFFLSIPSIIKFYRQHFIRNKPIVQEVTPTPTPIIPQAIDVSKKVAYNNDELKISLDYFQVASLSSGSASRDGNFKKIEIAYDKQNGQEKVTEENLKEGYILKITAFSLSSRTLKQVIDVEKAAYKEKCPQTATFSAEGDTKVNSISAKTFEIKNCGADYKLTYLQKSNLVYEFAQIYKGDIGYRQVYRAATDEIITSVRFYPEIINNGPLESFSNPNFSFKYPSEFNPKCCDMNSPISDKSTKLIVLGDPANIIDRTNYDGFGVFVSYFDEGKFNEYLDKQRKALIDDYVVVKGQSPTLQETSIMVGNKNGTMLEGYTWNQNKIIYVDLSNEKVKNKVMIFVIKNMSGDSFKTKIDEILKSFTFN